MDVDLDFAVAADAELDEAIPDRGSLEAEEPVEGGVVVIPAHSAALAAGFGAALVTADCFFKMREPNGSDEKVGHGSFLFEDDEFFLDFGGRVAGGGTGFANFEFDGFEEVGHAGDEAIDDDDHIDGGALVIDDHRLVVVVAPDFDAAGNLFYFDFLAVVGDALGEGAEFGFDGGPLPFGLGARAVDLGGVSSVEGAGVHVFCVKLMLDGGSGAGDFVAVYFDVAAKFMTAGFGVEDVVGSLAFGADVFGLPDVGLDFDVAFLPGNDEGLAGDFGVLDDLQYFAIVLAFDSPAFFERFRSVVGAFFFGVADDDFGVAVELAALVEVHFDVDEVAKGDGDFGPGIVVERVAVVDRDDGFGEAIGSLGIRVDDEALF